MKFGYWSPVWGSWLRNVDDDHTPCSWEYVRDLAVSLENKGYELTLVPELNLNDIKGHEAPVLDAWTVATGLATATQKLEILAASAVGIHGSSDILRECAGYHREDYEQQRVHEIH